MSFRGVDKDFGSLIRGLQDQINEIKRNTGKAKQNTLRLGNWVLSAEEDTRIAMTNLITKKTTYVGEQSIPFVGSKEWSYSGVVSPKVPFLAPAWGCPYPVTINRVIYHLQAASSSDYLLNNFIGTTNVQQFTLLAGRTFFEQRVEWDVIEGTKFFPGMEASSGGSGQELTVEYWYNGLYPGGL